MAMTVRAGTMIDAAQSMSDYGAGPNLYSPVATNAKDNFGGVDISLVSEKDKEDEKSYLQGKQSYPD